MKIITTAAIVTITTLGLGLAGCGTTPAVPQSFTVAVQTAATDFCQYEPTANTIASIFTSASPSAAATQAVANEVATAICNSVAPKTVVSAHRGVAVDSPFKVTAPGVVNGVDVLGTIVPKKS